MTKKLENTINEEQIDEDYEIQHYANYPLNDEDMIESLAALISSYADNTDTCPLVIIEEIKDKLAEYPMDVCEEGHLCQH